MLGQRERRRRQVGTGYPRPTQAPFGCDDGRHRDEHRLPRYDGTVFSARPAAADPRWTAPSARDRGEGRAPGGSAARPAARWNVISSEAKALAIVPEARLVALAGRSPPIRTCPALAWNSTSAAQRERPGRSTSPSSAHGRERDAPTADEAGPSSSQEQPAPPGNVYYRVRTAFAGSHCFRGCAGLHEQRHVSRREVRRGDESGIQASPAPRTRSSQSQSPTCQDVEARDSPSCRHTACPRTARQLIHAEGRLRQLARVRSRSPASAARHAGRTTITAKTDGAYAWSAIYPSERLPLLGNARALQAIVQLQPAARTMTRQLERRHDQLVLAPRLRLARRLEEPRDLPADGAA